MKLLLYISLTGRVLFQLIFLPLELFPFSLIDMCILSYYLGSFLTIPFPRTVGCYVTSWSAFLVGLGISFLKVMTFTWEYLLASAFAVIVTIAGVLVQCYVRVRNSFDGCLYLGNNRKTVFHLINCRRRESIDS